MARLTTGHFRLYVLGVALTAGVVVVQSLGVFGPLERFWYDIRAKTFQSFTPSPTRDLVHLDIDDRSINVIGRWPWKRSVLAGILDELKRAGAGPCAIDLIFAEPDPPEVVEDEFSPGTFTRVDHDQILARAIEHYGDMILPASFRTDDAYQPIDRASANDEALAAVFEKDPDADDSELVRAMVAQGVEKTTAEEYVARSARRVLTEVLRGKIEHVLDASPDWVERADVDAVKQKVLRDTGASAIERSTDVTRTLDQLIGQAMFARLVRARSPVAPADSGGMMRAGDADATVPAIARGAAGIGSVTFLKGPDGAFRCVPLVVRSGDRVVPHLALALACRALHVDLTTMKIEPGRIVLRRANGATITLPVRASTSEQRGRVEYSFDIPVWGSHDWRTMYEQTGKPSDTDEIAGHWPASKAWEAYDAEQALVRNGRRASVAMRHVLGTQDTRLAEAFDKSPPDVVDVKSVLSWIDRTLGAIQPQTAQAIDDQLSGKTPADPSDAKFNELALAVRVARTQRIEIAKLDTRLERLRADLRERVQGKSVLIGFTATGNVDFYPTAIHPLAPGVVVVGAVFNGIVTGEVWRTAPTWVGRLVGILFGLFMTAVVVRKSADVSAGVAVALVAAYLAFNGWVVFDYGNVLLDAAGPVVTVALVWAVGTGVRLAIEAKQRRRITRLFSSYVDPQLVDYFVARPDQVRLKGEVREMTVVFTDLAGFTSQMGRLGAATVPLLNEYMSRMVPVVRRRGGYLNKFLGDGILFFFGAPVPTNDHATLAVETVLDLMRETETLNVELQARGLPALHMRAGVSTGPMVVGDAGSQDACDYTVLGDAVNLGARLESANKQLGTRTLVSGMTAEQLKTSFLLRPVGRLKIVGFDEPVDCFEAIAKIEDATELQKKIADTSTQLIEAFRRAETTKLIQACDALDAAGDASNISSLYRAAAGASEGVLVLGTK